MSSLERLFRSWSFVWLLLVTVLALDSTMGSGYAAATFARGIEAWRWTTPDGGAGSDYSPLADTTPENVGDLRVAWRYRIVALNHFALVFPDRVPA